MQGNRVTFAPKPPVQVAERCFDFTSLLDEGDSIAGAAVQVSVWSGEEGLEVDNETIRLDGPRVYAEFSGGEDGSVYTVVCFGSTCDGQTQSLAAYLSVTKSAVS